MTNSFNAEMRRKLILMRAELLAMVEAGSEASQVVELDQSKIGRLSRMDAMQAQAMSQASGRRRQATLQMINLALKRIAQDEFGICRLCDEPIARRRLEYDPTVSLCIGCATEKEQVGQ